MDDIKGSTKNPGKIRVYRGLTQPYSPDYDLGRTDAPHGYSTWTDNEGLAREYAGPSGHVYHMDLPVENVGSSPLNENPKSNYFGDRYLAYSHDKPASINGVSGKEYLLYHGHDLFDSKAIKKSTKTPSKHTSWKRLEQIKRDHGVMASGDEHHQDDLDSAIVDAKVRDAEKMVQEADRMQRRPVRKSLAKGANGDWKKEGYKVSFEQGGSNPYAGLGRFVAHDSQGNQVGYLALYLHRSKTNEMVGAVKIEEPHRRKGLASHMYSVAEKTLGKKINPDINNSPNAKALWNQPNRPFGKSALQKDAPKFRLPRIKSISTRPDMEVHQVPSGQSFDRNTTRNRIAAVAANRASRAIDSSPEFSNTPGSKQNLLGNAFNLVHNISRRPTGGTTGGAVYGIKGQPKSGTGMASQDHDASRVSTEHEGHHLLFRQVDDKFGEQGRQKLVNHILSHFHPEDVNTMGKILGSGSYSEGNYKFNEEIANALRDLTVDRDPRERMSGIARASGHNIDFNRVKSGLKNAHRSLKNLDESFFHEQPQKPAASELEKSRPRITFPRFKRITTRPDQEIHEVGSERQKKIFGRKVAVANIPDSKDVKRTRAIQKPDGSMEFQDLPPGTIDRQADRDSAAKRVSRSLGTKVLGVVHHTKRGPMGAALSGKMYQSDFYKPKSSGGGEEYDAKLKEHYDKRNQMVRDYNAAFSDWHKKGMELSRDPSKLAELHEHLTKKPVKPKLPRKPSKPRVKGGAEEKLSREDMASRARGVSATTEHEGLHYIIDKVRGQYGKRAAKNTLDKLVDAHDPEAISHLSNFLTQRMRYKRNDPSFKEELIAHARDILVNPRKRDSFKKFVGENADKVISALKTGHQKAYKVAQSLNPEDVAEQSDFEGGKLAASEINKATMAGELAANESGGFKFPRFTKVR